MALPPIFMQLPIIFGLIISGACSWTSPKTETIILVGSTPGDELIKSQLGIANETNIDFIRWNLSFSTLKDNAFDLNITFGVGQPNTLGFKEGGQAKSYHGQYTILKKGSTEIYQLKSDQLHPQIELVKLNENLFQFLTPQHRLMVGNGGWSYMLNSKTPVNPSDNLPVLTPAFNPMQDTSRQLIFDGRTPCQDLAAEYRLNVSSECFKLKWKLILNRDTVSHKPTTYSIRKVVDNTPRDITGNWTIIKGAGSNPNAFIYQLDPEKPEQAISMLVGDENILYFINRDKHLFVGNENFSYTLNKRETKPQ